MSGAARDPTYISPPPVGARFRRPLTNTECSNGREWFKGLKLILKMLALLPGFFSCLTLIIKFRFILNCRSLDFLICKVCTCTKFAKIKGKIAFTPISWLLLAPSQSSINTIISVITLPVTSRRQSPAISTNVISFSSAPGG